MLTAFYKTPEYKKKLEEAKKEDDFDSFPTFKSEAPSENPLFIRKQTKLKFKQSQIRNIVETNVIEVVFKRRIWPIIKPFPWQKKQFRRMLCTSNWKFVQDTAEFKFQPPRGIRPRTKAWYKKRKLIIVWDLIHNDWRMISLDDYDIVNVFETNTADKQKEFVKNYNSLLKKGRNKLKLMFNK